MVDTPLGLVKIPVASIATECERDVKMVDAVLALTDGVGDIHMELDWVPLDNNLMKVSQLAVLHAVTELNFRESHKKEQPDLKLHQEATCL